MVFKNKSLLYTGLITSLLSFNIAYATEVEVDDNEKNEKVVEEEEVVLGGVVDNDLTLPVKKFPKIGPIHRGFQKNDDDSYNFIVMGQGKIHKSSLFPCFSAPDPGSYGIAQLIKLKEDEQDEGNWVEDETYDPVTFNMPVNDLRVGRHVFKNLVADSTYQLKIGYVKGDFENHSNDTPPDFTNAHVMTVNTPPVNPGNTATFLYGSCARIAKVGAVKLWDGKVNTLLTSMHQNIEDLEKGGVKTDNVFTLGDVPYMDPLNEFFAAKDLNEKHERVQILYGLGGARLLMQKAPTIQVRDDHEWWNDSSAEITDNRQNRANAAKKIYDLFQRPMGEETEEYYQIVDGNLEAFVCDARSERKPSENQFMSQEQMDALKAWLSDPSRADRIKPVFFSAPVLMLQTDDTFWHYKKQLSDFLNWIKDEDIKYLFFGTGDIHVGKTGLWQFEDGGPFILEDASSAFHKINHNKDALLTDQFDMTAAAPADDDGDDDDDKGDKRPKLSALGGLSPTVTKDHFTRVDLDHDAHTVTIKKYNRDNKLLMNVMYNLEDGSYDNLEGTQKYKVTPSAALQVVDDDNDVIE